MKRCCGYMVMIVVLLFGGIDLAVAQSTDNLYISDDKLVLQFDLQSPAQKLDSILKIAGISGASVNKLSKGDFSVLSKDGWNLGERKGSVVLFDKPLTDLNTNPQTKPIWITDNLPEFDGNGGYPANVSYGINRYAKNTVFGLASGFTRFILPGYTKARRVFLSGSFNQWSTLKGAMKKIGGGWMLDVKLEPGAYEYKFIVDGGWMTDPNNLQRINDGNGNVNSVYFKYNYTIRLAGHTNANKVVFSGDFNNWNEGDIAMDKKANGWEKQLYLSEGHHAYQFLVDGRAITDPANAVKQNDENGKVSSLLNIGQPATFRLAGYKNARKVYVAGDFNGWKPEQNAMQKTASGWMWNATLPAGNYQYRFVVDGNWMTDPANPNVGVEGGVTNSLIAIKPNHTFTLKGNGNAHTVRLMGTFNNWDDSGYTMTHTDNGWTISLYLKPGKYLYKFKVDDKWIIDPGNKLWEASERDRGTENSVLWME